MKILLFMLYLSPCAQSFAQDDCQELLNSQIKIVDESEALIKSMAAKDRRDITQFEIGNLQKMLTKRYAHLKLTMNAYQVENGCRPAILGDAVAIYDFTQLGNIALNDTKMRRIVNTIVKYPKYELTGLKKMYAHYTSHEFIEEFLQKLNAQKTLLPDNLSLAADVKDGKFVRTSDVAIKELDDVVSGSARLWGFLSDQLKWRSGRLKKNKQVVALMKQKLKPLDLIFETRKYVLSNLTIPGYWGHVAVWLGTKEELEQTVVWDKDFFKPFRKAVEAGANIVEIRKPGMQFVSLEDFISLDETAITRVKGITENIESVTRGLSEQLDAKYDFAFNALTPDKLTCAEMIAYSYGDIHWPGMKTILGVSLRPDDIAILSLYKNSPVEFVLYLKGNVDRSFEEKSIDDWKALFKDRFKADLFYF
jgi:hypothetical protein